MLPPGDSWQHQNLKLQEAIENINNIGVPPPAYMATTTGEGFVNQSIEDYTEDYEDEASQMSVSIAIDASIAIDGQNNSVIMPDPNPSTTPQDNSATSGSNLDNPGRIALLTEAVVRALQKSNIIAISGASQRPINLSINASIKIQGEKNVVFSGSKPAKKGTLGSLADREPTQQREEHIDEPGLGQKGTRKRRADSEAQCPPVGKKIHAG